MERKKNRIPIKEARNLGPVSASEMEVLEVRYLDQIEKRIRVFSS